MARKMKDSGIEWIGEIPEGWEVVQLKRFAEVHNGREIDVEVDSTDSSAVGVYGSGGVFKYTNRAQYSGKAVLFGRKGTLGKPLYVEGQLWAVDTMYFLTYSNRLLEKFSYYQFLAFNWAPYITHTAIPSVVASEIVACYFPIPPLEEQAKIVDYLDNGCASLDTILDKTRSSIEEYKKLKQAVITQAVTKGVRGEREMKDSGVEWIGEIPKEWGRTKIKMIASFFNGDRTSRYPQPSDFVDAGVAFLTSRNIDSDEVDLSETKYITDDKYKSLSGAKIQIDDIIFCLRGSVGKCAINRTLSCGTVASSLATIRPKDIYPKYLLYFLLSNIASTQTTIFMNGTCAANLSAENVGNYYITLPNAAEQKEIADHLDAKCAEIDKLIAKKEQLVKELESYKKSLIYEVVTGKREV